MTLGQLSERAGRIEEAIDLFTRAHQQARTAARPRRRAAGGVPAGPGPAGMGRPGRREPTAHQGVRRAEDAGLGLAPYGYDLQYLHYLAHYQAGEWDHAQVLADGFVTRVTSRARGQAVGHGAVHRRGQGPARRWPSAAPGCEPFFVRDRFTEYIGRGLLAEHALWHGDLTTAAEPRPRRRSARARRWTGLLARGDQARRGGAVRAGRPGLAGPRGRRRRARTRRRCRRRAAW